MYKLPFFLCAYFLLSAGCASYTQQTQEIRNNYRSGNYQKALAKLDESDIKPDGRHRLLYFLEKATILDRMDKLPESRKLLLKADSVADELYTTSISKEALTYVYNDSAQDYPGEDYEKVAIHTQLAMSFIESQDFKAATVQARKINNKLHEINQRYDEGKNKYSRDAFALYLSGIIFEKRGQVDDAIIDYKKSLKLYNSSFQDFAISPPPKGLVLALARLYKQRGRNQDLKRLLNSQKDILEKPTADWDDPKKSAEIVVIHEVGHIAHKKPFEFVARLGGELVRFSFPTINRKSHFSGGRTGVKLSPVSGSHDFNLADNAQDLNAIAFQTLEDRRGRIMLKQSARLIMKAQIRQQAKKNAGILGELAAHAYNVATEVADTRAWTSLPSAFYITRIRVEPGKYKLEIYADGRSKNLKAVTLNDKEMLILRDK